MPRPNRPGQTSGEGSGRLHSFGNALLGILAGNATSDVSVDPGTDSYTEDETNRLLSVPEDQRDEEANSIPTHPTVTANNWLSKGTANRLNTQLLMNQIGLNQGNEATAAGRSLTDPMDILKAKTLSADALNNQIILGNARLANENSIVANPANIGSMDFTGKIHAINAFVSKLKANDSANIAAASASDRSDVLAKTVFPDTLGKAGFDAALGVKNSANQLNEFAKDTAEKDALKQAQLAALAQKNKREGIMAIQPGGAAYNLDTGKADFISPYTDEKSMMRKQLMDNAPKVTTDSVSPYANALSPAPSQPASNVIPKYDPKVIDPKTGKPKYLGSVVNGAFVPASTR